MVSELELGCPLCVTLAHSPWHSFVCSTQQFLSQSGNAHHLGTLHRWQSGSADIVLEGKNLILWIQAFLINWP